MDNDLIINDHFKKQVINIMEKANNAIMKIFLKSEYDVKVKKDDSPVTKADLLAHQIIVKGLKELTPEIPIVSEEDEKSFSIRKIREVFWLIDPLDGTKEFIKKREDFTCNIGLIKNKSAIFGFVGVPAKNLIYFGGKSFKSYVRSSNGKISEIKCNKNKDALRIIASKSHLNDETKEFIDKLPKPYKLVTAGSSLKFLKIAEGNADIYPRMAPTSEWDTAAAQAVLEGSGGLVSQLNGKKLVYGKDEILNPKFIASNDNNFNF